MGSLVRVPLSEVMATLEVLDKLGVVPELFDLVRRDREYAAKVSKAFKSASSFPNSTESLFQILFKACHQDWVNDDITEEGFPLVDDGTGDKKIIEYVFDRTVTGYEAERELKKGHKLVGIKRAMEYVAQNPDAQKYHHLIVLGAKWLRAGNLIIPYFYWQGSERRFDYFSFDNDFPSSCRFLVIRDDDTPQSSNHIVDCDADPYLPSGWKVEEHHKGGQFVWDPTKVSLHLSPNQQGSKVIEGHKLRKELVCLPNLNANVLDYLLAHPELIPESWKGKVIFFWGTIYRGANGVLYVRCLCWDGGQWRWFRWLSHDWSVSDPAAVLASV